MSTPLSTLRDTIGPLTNPFTHHSMPRRPPTSRLLGQPLFFGAQQSLWSTIYSKSLQVKGPGPAPVFWSSTITMTHYLQQKSPSEGSWANPCFGAQESLGSIIYSKSLQVKGPGPAPVFWSSTITMTHHLQQNSPSEGSSATPCCSSCLPTIGQVWPCLPVRFSTRGGS